MISVEQHQIIDDIAQPSGEVRDKWSRLYPDAVCSDGHVKTGVGNLLE